eukprot:1019136-Rhodomonas_salina.2
MSGAPHPPLLAKRLHTARRRDHHHSAASHWPGFCSDTPVLALTRALPDSTAPLRQPSSETPPLLCRTVDSHPVFVSAAPDPLQLRDPMHWGDVTSPAPQPASSSA